VLESELAELRTHLSSLNRPVLEWMLPGAAPEEVRALLGDPLPQEVAGWFGWCNGVAFEPDQTQDQVNIIPGYSPLSLREALDARPSYEGDPALTPRWIPLLRSAGGDIYAAVWDKEHESARVAGVLIGEATEFEFGSVEQMVAVFNACYRSQAFSVDPSGQLSMDPDRYDAVYEEATGSDGG
jgi:hypothetical protein